MIPLRHRLLESASCGLLACAAAIAPARIAHAAEDAARYPSHPVRLVVTYPPGGGTDIVARIIAPRLGESLGQPVVIDNLGGAGGTIGTAQVAKAAPDGYTLLFGTTSGLVINPLLKKDLPYDPVRDFAPIGMVVSTPQMLVVKAGLPVASVGELVAYAKHHPDKLNYASVGVGTPNHIAMEMFKSMTGTRLVHIPYKGAGPAINDLLGGQVDLMFNPIAPLLRQVNAGTIKALAVSSAKRSSAAPALPTVAEAGVPGFESDLWYGLFAPAGTPRPLIEKLSAALARVLAEPDIARKLVEQGAEPRPGSPDEMRTTMRVASEHLARLIKAASITAE